MANEETTAPLAAPLENESISEGASETSEGATIASIGILDLTGTDSAGRLEGVTLIKDIGVLLIRESLQSALLNIRMENIGLTVPVPDGANISMLNGQIKLAGEALGSEQIPSDQILVVVGQLFITTPVQKVAYKGIVMIGQMIAPKGSEAALGAAITKLTGQTIYYAGTPRVFTGDDSFSNEFFELLDEPITMVLAGDFIFDATVTRETLKAKVKEIVLAGDLKAPKSLIPLVQALTVEKAGDISALED